jgi:translocator assembly and maintenance protein 41
VQTIKYGVVGMETLLRDLWTWDTLQVAGRLHKPVRHIIRDPAVMTAINANLEYALAASLLTLPRSFTTAVRPLFCPLSFITVVLPPRPLAHPEPRWALWLLVRSLANL